MSRSSQIRILEHKAEQRLIAVNVADGVARSNAPAVLRTGRQERRPLGAGSGWC